MTTAKGELQGNPGWIVLRVNWGRVKGLVCQVLRTAFVLEAFGELWRDLEESQEACDG